VQTAVVKSNRIFFLLLIGRLHSRIYFVGRHTVPSCSTRNYIRSLGQWRHEHPPGNYRIGQDKWPIHGKFKVVCLDLPVIKDEKYIWVHFQIKIVDRYRRKINNLTLIHSCALKYYHLVNSFGLHLLHFSMVSINEENNIFIRKMYRLGTVGIFLVAMPLFLIKSRKARKWRIIFCLMRKTFWKCRKEEEKTTWQSVILILCLNVYIPFWQKNYKLVTKSNYYLISLLMTGTVKFLMNPRGYGFITNRRTQVKIFLFMQLH